MEQISILDLLPKPVSVEVVPGKAITVRSLGLTDIAELVWEFQDELVAMYDESSADQPDYSRFVLASPKLVAAIIAAGANAKGQEEAVAQLPGTVQLIALTEIWRMSVPDPKKLSEALKMIAAEIQRLKQALAAQKAADAGIVVPSSSTTSPS